MKSASRIGSPEPKGLWILPEAWKTLRVSHPSLDGAGRLRPQDPQALLLRVLKEEMASKRKKLSESELYSNTAGVGQ